MPTSNDIFVDTSRWGCYLDRRETDHQLAVTICQQAALRQRKLITSNYVISELVALLASRLHFPRTQVFTAIDMLKASSFVEIAHVDATLDAAAWSLLKNRADKKWSLVDASRFVMMDMLNPREALATDHHFAQAGFTVLLPNP